jgi:phage terminase large subunit
MSHNPLWAPDYEEEWFRRCRNWNMLLADRELAEKWKLHYKTHPIDWIEDWAITFDPRAKPPKEKLMPFMLFPRQRDFVKFIVGCLQDKESGLIEKSRDMGATWLCCALSVWLWLFHPGSIIGWGSLKAEQVDSKDNPKAIFPKIRMIIEKLPYWMLPAGFDMRTHGTYMQITNPANLCVIQGECGTNMGRGGRTSIYFKDESAHYEHPELIEAALGDNTDVQIDMSSVNGAGNVFYRRRFSKFSEIWYPDIKPIPGNTRVFIFDWRENPLKNEEWYQERKRKAEAEGLSHIFAQEVDRDYAASKAGIIIPAEWTRSCIDAHIKLGINPKGGVRRAGQDVADGGHDKNALAITHNVILRYCESMGGDGGDAARACLLPCMENRVSELYYDSIGVGAGFKVEINNLRERGMIPQRLRIFPWNAGASPIDPTEHIIPGDPESMTNEEMYENIKAQGYFRLRARIYKTHRMVQFGEQFPHEELFSIDSTLARRDEIILELSQPVHKASKKGKTMVDKTPDGQPSPNLADSINQVYNPTKEISILDVIM